ncbi:hypothetical protein V6N12_028620 [Hibiscus sabdariffa]|uniref:Uncharacterized protein n=1 Tax=Hibiscus sabdariffa TaxID=183260 RepID=A0ABR2F6B9_9ROSI
MVPTSTPKLEDFFGVQPWGPITMKAAPTMADDGAPGMKLWVSRNFSTKHAMHQKMISWLGDNGVESGSIGAITYGDL